jgi:hypothetical protein
MWIWSGETCRLSIKVGWSSLKWNVGLHRQIQNSAEQIQIKSTYGALVWCRALGNTLWVLYVTCLFIVSHLQNSEIHHHQFVKKERQYTLPNSYPQLHFYDQILHQYALNDGLSFRHSCNLPFSPTWVIVSLCQTKDFYLRIHRWESVSRRAIGPRSLHDDVAYTIVYWSMTIIFWSEQ